MTMTSVALIGCGKHMQTTLARYLRRFNSLRFEICVDPVEEAARRVQHLLDAQECASAVEDIDTSRIDAAVLALPPEASFKVTKYLIEQRIPCFVEKPVAPSTAAISSLMQLAEAQSVYVQVGYNFRFADAVRSLYARVADYREMQCTMLVDFKSRHPGGPEWGIDDALEAWLRNNGVHALDLIHWFFGGIRNLNTGIIRSDEGKFLITLLATHSSGSISVLRLGNITSQFEIRIEMNTTDAGQFSMPHLGEVTCQSGIGRSGSDTAYRTRNLDDGWGRAGYGTELDLYFASLDQPPASFPSLLDAHRASALCDRILETVKRDPSATQRGSVEQPG